MQGRKGVEGPPIVYLDHAATTPLDPRVLAAMLPYLKHDYGNPSSIHGVGRQALAAVDTARERVAELFRCDPDEVVFTGSGTEADNLAIRGVVGAARLEGRPAGLAVSSVEHEAVSETARSLAETQGHAVRMLGVDREGGLIREELREALTTGRLGLVSVLYAQNETGRIQNLPSLGREVHDAGALLHTDAVAAATSLTLDRTRVGADLMSLSAHKIYGPKGAGALYVRREVRLLAATTGGGQEHSRRAGTHNVPAIVGLGRAAALLLEEREERVRHLESLSKALTEALTAVEGVVRTVSPAVSLPGTLHVMVQGAPSDSLLIGLDTQGIEVSAGSACSAGAVRPSHILLAMGYSPEEARTGLRFSLGRQNTLAEIERVADVWPQVVRRVRDAHARAGMRRMKRVNA